MALPFNKKAVKQNRPEPQTIISIARQMENCDEAENRVIPMQGKGKSEATVYLARGDPKPDIVSGYQHTTTMDKWKAWHQAKKDGIIPKSRRGEFVCGFQKCLGVKDHNGDMQSIEYLDKSEVPDKFTVLWDSKPSERKEAIKDLVNHGGKEAKMRNPNNTFVEVYLEQLKGPGNIDAQEYYKNKVIFCTVDMAKIISSIISGIDGESRHFVDEGIAGRIEGDEISDVSQKIGCLDRANKKGSTTQHRAKDIKIITNPHEKDPSKYNRMSIKSEIQEIIDKACQIQEHIEQGNHIQKRVVPPFNKDNPTEIEVGKYQMPMKMRLGIHSLSIENLPQFDGQISEYIQQMENSAYRSELIQIRKLIEWLKDVEERGLVFQKEGSDIHKMEASKHHLKNLREMDTEQFFLLRASYPKDWDKAMKKVEDFDPNILCQSMSLRSADLSRWDANFWKVEPNKSLNKNRRDGQWCEYLHRILDETDWLKTSVGSISNRFSDHFYYYEEIMGKDLKDYENHYLASVPRLNNSDLYYEAVKEFKVFPDLPQNKSARKVKNGNLLKWNDPFLQAVHSDRVEGKFIDAWLRTARSEDDNSDIYIHALVHMANRWIGNIEWAGILSGWKELLDILVIENQIFEEAIDIADDYPVNLEHRVWIQGRENWRVNLQWAVDYYEEIDSAKELSKITGRNRSTCRSALQ